MTVYEKAPGIFINGQPYSLSDAIAMTMPVPNASVTPAQRYKENYPGLSKTMKRLAKERKAAKADYLSKNKANKG